MTKIFIPYECTTSIAKAIMEMEARKTFEEALWKFPSVNTDIHKEPAREIRMKRTLRGIVLEENYLK